MFESLKLLKSVAFLCLLSVYVYSMPSESGKGLKLCHWHVSRPARQECLALPDFSL